MRNLADCITRILKIVPEADESLIFELCNIRSEAFPHADEQSGELWQRAEQLLLSRRTFSLADEWLNESMFILTGNKFWEVHKEYASLSSRPLRVAASLLGFVNSDVGVLLCDIVYWCMIHTECEEARYLLSYINDHYVDDPMNTVVAVYCSDINQSPLDWIRYHGYSIEYVSEFK